MKKYIRSSEPVKIKTRFYGYKEFDLEPTGETVSFSYWGRRHDNLPVYEAQDGSLWAYFDDSWYKLKYTSQGFWIPSNITALELNEWEAWNAKQKSDDWWR